jgi:carboxylesterase
VVLAAVLLLRPLSPAGFASHPHPAPDYQAALRLVAALRDEDTPAISPECGTGLMTHGARTSRVVVLLHGLTNCPAQFDSLGRLCFERGANVLIPRLPRHGRAQRMTDALAGMDARELCAFTDRVLDAAHGLGDSVTVAGLSIGGVLAAWAGQERHDVDRAVVIAPMLGWARAPRPLAPALTRLMCALPNAFIWWDSQRREQLLGPRHVYPRFATRAVGATLLLGGAVLADARRAAPACRSVVMVTVGGDIAADNRITAALVDSWRARGAREVVSYEFPGRLHLNHDVVDPEQAGGNPAVTYPVLMRLIGP